MVRSPSDSSSSDTSSSDSSESSSEFESAINEKASKETNQSIEKVGVGEETSTTKKTNSKIKKQDKEKKQKEQDKEKRQRKKKLEDKSTRILQRAIVKQKKSQQKLNRELSSAKRQFGLERRKQLLEINRLKKKIKVD